MMWNTYLVLVSNMLLLRLLNTMYRVVLINGGYIIWFYDVVSKYRSTSSKLPSTRTFKHVVYKKLLWLWG